MFSTNISGMKFCENDGDEYRGTALLPHICNVSDVRRHEGDLSRVSHEDVVFLACWRSWWRLPHNATKRLSAVPSSMGSTYSVRSRWRRIAPVPSAAIGWQLNAARRSSAPSNRYGSGAAFHQEMNTSRGLELLSHDFCYSNRAYSYKQHINPQMHQMKHICVLLGLRPPWGFTNRRQIILSDP